MCINVSFQCFVFHEYSLQSHRQQIVLFLKNQMYGVLSNVLLQSKFVGCVCERFLNGDEESFTSCGFGSCKYCVEVGEMIIVRVFWILDGSLLVPQDMP